MDALIARVRDLEIDGRPTDRPTDDNSIVTSADMADQGCRELPFAFRFYLGLEGAASFTNACVDLHDLDLTLLFQRFGARELTKVRHARPPTR
jgi:hypothetical protein